MKLHQFVHTLSYGDAISSEALTIKRILNEQGIESEIYRVHVDPRFKSLTRYYQEFQPTADAAVLLHFSIASPLNELFLSLENIKRAVLYHNLTPEKWFFSYNSRVVEDLRSARAALESVIRAADVVIGDSSYNLLELANFLTKPGRVLPLPFDDKKWAIETNPGIVGILKGHGGVNILSVGRVAPNKCLEDVIKAFYFYHHKINRFSRLWLTGSDIDTEIYAFELKELISTLNLQESVYLVGPVADTELKAFYEASDLYVCMSEHEGFCVPLIEAMNFSLPLIAYDSCAVSETVGMGGLLVTEKHHAKIAELMDQILTNAQLKSELKHKAQAELSRFGLSKFKENLQTQLLEPLKELTAFEMKRSQNG
jgi:glycosyltransferase involved in cell wall biosynthesis